MEKTQGLEFIKRMTVNGRRWGSSVWTDLFSNGTGKLPIGEDKKYIMFDNGMEVLLYLVPRPDYRRRCHRVFVECPLCGKFVPAGRVHQHVCKEVK